MKRLKVKIHSLFISNIASLKGKHRIDFEKINQTSNLFAITGKTGSGKSTILNCISLALYGDVYKKNSNSVDFITLGESMGEIDLVFSTNYKKYKASWRLRTRKKNGEELKKPQLTRLFYHIGHEGHEEALESTPEEVCHLSFNQFCKTTILNQGQFSKFLTSNFTERKEILEKFYQGESLEGINTHLKNKIKNNQIKKEEKENLIKGISETFANLVFNESDIDTLNKQISENKIFMDSAQKILGHIKDAKDLTETTEATTSRNKVIQEIIETVQIDLNESFSKRDQAEIINKKNEIYLKEQKPILNESIKKEIKKENLEAQLQKIILAENNSQVSLSKVIKDKEDNKENIDKLHSELNSFSAHQQNFDEWDITILLKDYNQASISMNEFKVLKEEEESSQKELEEKSIEKSDLTTKSDSYKFELESYHPKHHRDEIENSQKVLDQLNIINSKLTTCLIDSKVLSKDIASLEQDISTAKNELNDSFKNLDELHLKKADLSKMISLHKLAESIHLCITESEKNQKCIVCGNTDSLDLNSAHLQGNSLDIKQTQERLIECENKIQLTQNRQNEFKVSLNSKEMELKSLSKQLNSISSSILNELKIIDGLGVQNKVDEQLQKELRSLIEEHTNRIIKAHKKINFMTIQNEKLLNTKKRIEGLSQELIRLNGAQSKRNEKMQALKAQIASSLKKYLIEFVSIRDGMFKFKIIKDDFEKYTKLKESLNLFIVKTEALHQYHEKLNTEIKDVKKEKEVITTEIRDITLFIAHNTRESNPTLELKEIEEKVKSSTLFLNETLKECKTFEIQLAENRSKLDLNKDQIKSCETLRASNLIDLKLLSKGALNLKEPPFNGFTTITKILNNLNIIKEKEVSATILGETFNHLKVSLSDFNNFCVDNEKKLSEITALLNQRSKNKDKIKEIEKDLLNLKTIQDELDELNQLIGKDEFRNYILAIIENLLLDQTNKELKILCQGRYGIIQTNKTNKMASEFKVIDYFMDGYERKISTLSGGETFLVSLAMAMALAELTRGSTQIDSLFIDEGFGTLDSESINEVFDLLLEIQHTGKQIGIISHISQLTNRIPVNINLNKNQNGLSDINVLIN